MPITFASISVAFDSNLPAFDSISVASVFYFALSASSVRRQINVTADEFFCRQNRAD